MRPIESTGVTIPTRGDLRLLACAGFTLLLPCATALAQMPQTEIVSLDSHGLPGTQGSFRPSISGDGSLVAFQSFDRLVPSDTNPSSDVYLRDRSTGITVLVSTNGSVAAGSSKSPRISADGRFVAFESSAASLPGGSTGVTQVYRYEITTHILQLASLNGAGAAGSLGSDQPSISADGSRVAFRSWAQLDSIPNSLPTPEIFVRDFFTGTTYMVSETGGVAGNGSGGSQVPAISGDGSFVAFHSDSGNLANTMQPHQSLVLGRHLPAGQMEIISINGTQVANTDASAPSVSSTGQFVAFHSGAATLGATAPIDIFRRDRLNMVTIKITSSPVLSMFPSISADGCRISFHTATIYGSGYSYIDVFTWDCLTGQIVQESVDSNGSPGNGTSGYPSLSAGGACVAFESNATNLVSQATSGTEVYLHGTCTPQTGTPFCFGDGSGTQCPCANNGRINYGCDNYLFTGGGRLSGSGTASLANDTLRLDATNLRPSTTTIFFQGDNAVIYQGTSGAPFGNGLRCVQSGVIRLGAVQAMNGTASFGNPPSISQLGHVNVPGPTKLYQVWYRDPPAMCLMGGPSNFTNGFAVTWAP